MTSLVEVVDEAGEGSIIDAIPQKQREWCAGSPAFEADGELKAGERPVHGAWWENWRRGSATELGIVQDVY